MRREEKVFLTCSSVKADNSNGEQIPTTICSASPNFPEVHLATFHLLVGTLLDLIEFCSELHLVDVGITKLS